MSSRPADDAAARRRRAGEGIQTSVSDRDAREALCIFGPTSSGKSEVAVLVAEAVGGEIVNADSRQIYRDLSIGTGAPDVELLRRVPHHLFGFVDPCDRY